MCRLGRALRENYKGRVEKKTEQDSWMKDPPTDPFRLAKKQETKLIGLRRNFSGESSSLPMVIQEKS